MIKFTLHIYINKTLSYGSLSINLLFYYSNNPTILLLIELCSKQKFNTSSHVFKLANTFLLFYYSNSSYLLFTNPTNLNNLYILICVNFIPFSPIKFISIYKPTTERKLSSSTIIYSYCLSYDDFTVLNYDPMFWEIDDWFCCWVNKLKFVTY